MRKWGIALLVMVGVGALALLAYRQLNGATSTAETAEVYLVRNGALTRSVHASGNLAAARTSVLSWATDGTIAAVPVEAGVVVSPGTLIAALDTRPLELDVASAKANLEAARTGLASAQASLADLQAGPKAEDLEKARIGLDQAKDRRWSAQAQRDATCGRVQNKQGQQVDCDSAEASVLQAEDAVRLAELELQLAQRGATELALAAARDKVAQATASLRAAEARQETAAAALKNAQVSSPISGTLSALDAAVGASVQAGKQAAVVSDLSGFDVALRVGEADVTRLALGGKASVVTDAFPDRPLEGSITYIAPVGEQQSGVVLFPVTVRVSRGEDPLRAGMSATVSMVTDEASDVPVIPLSAVQTIDGQTFVSRLVQGADLGDPRGGQTGDRGPPPPAEGGPPPFGTPGAGARPVGTPGAMGGARASAFATRRAQRGAAGGGSASGAGGGGLVLPATDIAQQTELVPVTLGLKTDTQAQVLSGLAAGDRIVIVTSAAASSGGTNTRGGFGFGIPMGGPPPDGGR